MIDQQVPIEPPPSLEAILTGQGRIGRVDFSHRLLPEPPPTAAPAAEVGATAVPTGPVAEIAPPPSVEELVGDASQEPDSASPEASEPKIEVPRSTSDEAPDEMPAGPRAVYPVEEPQPAHATPGEASPEVSSLLSLVPAEDAATVVEDIDDVVDGVIARMREVQLTTMAHLEATEIEAALRAEMLTAQAELDAELIRLHARREAHAIIGAARQRAGLPQPPRAEDQRRRLDQLGEAAERLAEELDALGADRGTPDHPRRR